MSDCQYRKPSYYTLILLFFFWLGFCYQIGQRAYDDPLDDRGVWWTLKQTIVAPFVVGNKAADWYFDATKD